MGSGSKKSAILPQLGLVHVECNLKRKRNNHLFTGNPLKDTFANNEDQDKKLLDVVFHQGLHCLLIRKKKIFRQKYDFLKM